jgi:hypothetical protein
MKPEREKPIHQGGQGPGQGRGANPGEIHSDQVPGEEGTGPGLSTGLRGRKGKGTPQLEAEQRSKEADAGVADEQEGPDHLGREERKHLHGDAGVAKR